MKKRKNDSFELEETLETEFGKGDFHHPDSLTADEILKSDISSSGTNSAMDSLIKRMTGSAKQNSEDGVSEEKSEKTLLDKCMPYIIDEDGKDASVNEKPLYELASVAEILEADSKRTLEKLSKEYGIVFENTPEIPEIKTQPKKEEPQEVTVPAEKEPEKKPEPEESKIADLPVISDIDTPDFPVYRDETPQPMAEHTVTFTPISSSENKKISNVITSNTRAFDFTGEILKIGETATAKTDEVTLEQSEFEEYTPKEEFTDKETGKQLLKGFAKKKKYRFFAMWANLLLTLLTAFFLLPFMSDAILSSTRVCTIITSAFTLSAVLLNIKSFLGFGKIFSKKADADALVSLSVLAVTLYSIFGIITGEIIIKMQVILLIILSFYSVNSFFKISAALRSFKQIYNTAQKTGVTLISDPAISLAMTKGSVEGETLIAAGQSAGRIEDFMKYSTFGTFLNGKANIIAFVALGLGILSGIVAFAFFDSLLYAFYSSAAVLCLITNPVLLMIDTFPLYHSSKKLARRGAMIAGKTGAEQVEEANAVVINSKDIFPSGSITLHRMQVLSENNLEDTILRAASLTEAMQSPLSPIFKKIAGNSNITSFPNSDTIKYEEALGISGWVDDRLMFIGNRTLLEAHGISVPDVDLDRKILMQGYFPVYVASGNKAYALLVVKYEADYNVAKELRTLTNSGVTLLVKTSDPNLTEEMICDYFGLYEDTVKVMTAAGCHIYVNTVSKTDSLSAPAAYKANPLALPTILNCAGKIKRSNLLLTIAFALVSALGVLLFCYTSFGGSGSPLSDTAVMVYSTVTAAITYLIYLTQKP